MGLGRPQSLSVVWKTDRNQKLILVATRGAAPLGIQALLSTRMEPFLQRCDKIRAGRATIPLVNTLGSGGTLTCSIKTHCFVFCSPPQSFLHDGVKKILCCNRADGGWDGQWTLVNHDSPLYGWGEGSEQDCTDDNGCPSHEDPHLWWDSEGGAHLLTHDQNNHVIHSTRGAYGWSSDGLSWILETPMFKDAVHTYSSDGRVLSNASAWPMVVAFDNQTVRSLARRQRPSLITDPDSGVVTHVIQGSDFSHHTGTGPSWCDGCHWGSGFTLIQPLASH
jgi:hypothetical protein